MSGIWGLSSDYDTALYSVVYIALVYSKSRVYLGFIAGGTGRADEVRSGVGLGSSAIHITGLIRHSFVRLA